MRVPADRAVLAILLAVNAGGKDGTVAEVTAALPNATVRMEHFLKPPPGATWRSVLERAGVARPAPGELVFFNRSYYEELIRVAAGPQEFQEVARAINELENDFATLHIDVVKLFLHVDRTEQKRRLEERRTREELHHLHNPADARDQERWDELMEEYEAALAMTHTATSPWFVIPANRRALRNSLVATILLPYLEC